MIASEADSFDRVMRMLPPLLPPLLPLLLYVGDERDPLSMLIRVEVTRKFPSRWGIARDSVRQDPLPLLRNRRTFFDRERHLGCEFRKPFRETSPPSTTGTSLLLRWREQPFRRRPFSPSRATSALLSVLPSSPHSLGYYTPQRAPRISSSPGHPPQPSARSLAVGALPSTTILPRLPTSRGWASELVQIPMRPREQRKPITDSSCAIS